MADLDVLEKLLEQTEKPKEASLGNGHRSDRNSDDNYRDSHKEKVDEKHREDRLHSRSRSRDRKRRKYGRSRSRSRERSYNRYTSRDYDRKYRRSRYDRSRSRSRSRDRYSRRRRSRSRDRDRYSRRRSRSKERLERERREREDNDRKYQVDEHERDLRTVFIRSLPTKADARDITKWFEKASAPVREVRLITDKYTKKSKGFGYVEFYQKESVEKALSLSGSQLLGKTVYVELSEAEKNIEASSDIRASTRIYVSNLYHEVTEEMLRNVFEKFGDIEYLNLHFNAGTDVGRGFAFVQYKSREAAVKAVSMNGVEICGRAMKVGFVTSKKEGNIDNLNSYSDSNLDLDDSDYITGQQRYELMRSLNNRVLGEYGDSDVSTTNMKGPEEEIYSDCILVEHMFDPNEEENPNFDKELEADVRMECTNQYGPIDEIYVDKMSMGNVYIKFKSVEFAKKAFLGLNGRWFDGKVLSVTYISLAVFLEKAKKA